MRIGTSGQSGLGAVNQEKQDIGNGPGRGSAIDGTAKTTPGEQGQIPAKDDLHPSTFGNLLYRPQPTKPAAEPSKPGPLRKMLDQSLKSEQRLDRYLHRAMRGHVSDLNELLALQMQVYRYTQQVEVLSRVVDRSTGSIKQILQTRL